MTRRRIWSVGAVAAAAALGGWLAAAHAQVGMWAIDTHACAPDGSRCIKGVVKNNGPPYATKDACEKALQALAKQYHEANLKVMYIHCVQLRR